jgi:predicted enzyme related to lactoylglutathione lyase
LAARPTTRGAHGSLLPSSSLRTPTLDLETRMTTGTRKPGEFCWFDVMTKDFAATKAMFTKLFGWTYMEVPTPPHGNYTMAMTQGGTIGGFTDVTTNPMAKGVPPHMGPCVLVKSCDETAKAVTANGGKLINSPFDVMDQGRMFLFTDPTGATLACWEGKKMHGMTCDTTKHGAPSWMELMTTDVDRAGAFYAKVFDWTPKTSTMPSMTYTEFKAGNESVAGMMGITKEMGKMPSNWACYMTVDDVDQTAKDCKAMGGTVCVEPSDIPSVGRFTVLQTKDGVTFSAIAYKR